MGIIVGILIAILMLICILLVLIILMQKSKQEAGLGAAFGGAATEQLFGAGTTSVLTKATIWGTTLFFIITLVLAIYYSHEHKKSISAKLLSTIATNAVANISAPPSATNAPAAPEPVTAETNAPPALTGTNAPATK
jgi:preprotein translocase subunit SecG